VNADRETDTSVAVFGCSSERSKGHSLGNCEQRYVIVSACPSLGKRASKFAPSLKPLIV